MLLRHLLVTTLVAAAPSLLHAQTMPARVTRSGGYSFELSNGEPVSFYLEHSTELELTEEQKAAFIAIRKRLRQTNAPFTRQLDSLRDALGLSIETRERIRDSDNTKLKEFRRLSVPIADSLRVYNDAARNEVWVLLQDLQRTKADSVMKAERSGLGRPPVRRPGAH